MMLNCVVSLTCSPVEDYELYISGDVAYQSPLTPADLLIALHNLDDKVDMKTTIKGIKW